MRRHGTADEPEAGVKRAAAKAGYSGTPLPRKLGVRPATTVALVDAPDGFERALDPLPGVVRLRRSARGACDVALWFVGTKAAYARGLHAWARRDDWRALWICWPKKASGVRTDLSDGAVRTLALAAGLVDYKVCAVDATWSGLCFARRKPADHAHSPTTRRRP
jgi:hypothetical protein